MAKLVIAMPYAIAKEKNKPTVVIIDEFQALTNVVAPDTNRYYDIINFFQKASETQHAPLIVSGSSISMMVDEALVGALSGRFQSTHLEPLTPNYATDMMFRLADVYDMVKPTVVSAIWLKFVGGVMEKFDQRAIDGPDYFSVHQAVALPKMKQIERREGVIKQGRQNEIDVISEYVIPGEQEGPL